MQFISCFEFKLGSELCKERLDRLFNNWFSFWTVFRSGDVTEGGINTISVWEEWLSFRWHSERAFSGSSSTGCGLLLPMRSWMERKCDLCLDPHNWMVDILGVDWNGLLICSSSSLSSQESLPSSNWMHFTLLIVSLKGRSDCMTPLSSLKLSSFLVYDSWVSLFKCFLGTKQTKHYN